MNKFFACRTYIHTYIHTYTHTYRACGTPSSGTYASLGTKIDASNNFYIYIHIHKTHIHTYIHTYMHTYIQIHTYIHTYIHIYI